MMRGLRSFRLGLGLLTMTTLPALAEGTVSIVVPNRSDVPVIINGVDASWSVIEGDWGLARGTHIQPTIYGGRPIDPTPDVGHYYPSEAKTPGYGRLEIEPRTRKPRRAESYFRSYSAQSDPPRIAEPPEPPAIIDAPYSGQGVDPSMRRRRN